MSNFQGAWERTGTHTASVAAGGLYQSGQIKANMGFCVCFAMC